MSGIRIELGDPDVNVVAWGDPITGVVWETVYPAPGKAATATTVGVWGEREHDAYMTPRPFWFPVTVRNTYVKVSS